MNTKPEQAVNNFKEGSNCSQAVLSVYAEESGLSRKTALKIARGFGGGMGRMAQTCGAVTGAFMVLGLKYGNADIHDKEAREKIYGLVREFVRRFESRNSSIVCRELLGCDISKPEGAMAAKENGLFTSVCPELVRDAAEILDEMINE
ncbi:MAG TPA: C-GCAxxG-C-C family protein [Sedimentisphaerales bacterium]|nr:C-GCAxxG-C-C family protein [Sedimentisphaerales bacterium]